MLVPINDQAYIFLYTVVGGLSVGLIYDLFRISRMVIRTNNIIVYIEDILFWLLVSFVTLGTLFISNAGEIRGYSLVGIVLGVIIYYFMLSNIIVKILVKCINILKKIVKYIYMVIRIPIVFIMKIFYWPILYVYKFLTAIGHFFKKISCKITDNLKLNIKNIKVTMKKF